jgi:hypothetical protein
VFAGETLGTFQLDDQHVIHEDVGKVLSHVAALVGYRKRDLGSSPDAPKAERTLRRSFARRIRQHARLRHFHEGMLAG